MHRVNLQKCTVIFVFGKHWEKTGIDLKNPGKFPLRLPYGNDDTTTNPNVQAAYGNGQYVYTENVWWAGGTR